MDPDCAICHAPATRACDCEAKGLEVAIRQAESRMMQSVYSDVRYGNLPAGPAHNVVLSVQDVANMNTDPGYEPMLKTTYSSISGFLPSGARRSTRLIWNVLQHTPITTTMLHHIPMRLHKHRRH
jgi:hypothetical protein